MSHRLTDSKKMFKSSKDRQYSFEDFNCLENYRFAKRVFNEDQEYQVTWTSMPIQFFYVCGDDDDDDDDLTNYLVRRHFWEANRPSTSQEIPRTLWNSKVHDHIHKSASFVPLLSQIDSANALSPTSLRFIWMLSSHLPMGFPSDLLPSSFPTKTVYSSLPAPCMLHALPISVFFIWSLE